MRPIVPLLLLPTLAACASIAPTSSARAPLPPDIAKADVVFFGEAHDDRRMHAYERDLLEAVDQATDGRGPTLLGMEMFQRPFQRPLDDYVAGRIDEKEMLRRTEYFGRWRFDHTLYAPLWRYCRAHGVRIVALNAEEEIAHKLGASGLAGLTDDERARIPRDLDLVNAEHRKRLMPAFDDGGPHKLTPAQRENYYQAMIVWDETMGATAAEAFAAAGPGARMLVVAGRGHIEEMTGVPDRFTKRVPNAARVVVVGEVPEKDAKEAAGTRTENGQFVVVFPQIEEPPAPKLSVNFDPTPSAAGLLVKSVMPGGAGAAAGIRAGDRIARFAGEDVTDLTDFRFAFDTKKTGDVVPVEVLRDGARVTLSVTMAPPPETPGTSSAK